MEFGKLHGDKRGMREAWNGQEPLQFTSSLATQVLCLDLGVRRLFEFPDLGHVGSDTSRIFAFA
jgi:hypothetical protein